MRAIKLTAITFAALVFFAVSALAEDPTNSRITVLVGGRMTQSNDILYQYAGNMDLAAIDGLVQGHEDEMIPPGDLEDQLPDALNGWTASDPSSMSMSYSGHKYSFAAIDFEDVDSQAYVNVILYDTVYQETGPWDMYWMEWGMDHTNPYGFVRSDRYKGYPMLETRDNIGKSGSLVIALAPETQISEFGILVLFPSLAIGAILVRLEKN